MEEKKRRFKWRGVTTFLLILSVLVEIVSGIVLYITPPGRVANWTNWTLWGLNKHEWGAMHTIFGYLLLIIIAGHLYYNWRVVVAFVWSRMRKTFNLKRELAVATVVSLVVFLGTFWNLPPFSTVMNFGDKVKHSWESGASPRGRWKGNSLASSSIPSTVDKENRSMGWKRNNTLSPGLAYAETTPYTKGGSPADRGTGFGRKTLETICSENHVPAQEGLSRLRNQGIEASSTDRIRDLANRSGKRPSEIIQLITGNKVTSRGSAQPGLIPRSAPFSTPESKTEASKENVEKMKGRDFARLGNIAPLMGTLSQEGDEWMLKVGDTVYELHLGPADYRAHKGLVLKDGNQASVTGFIYGTDVAVATIETAEKSITLRDETGRPAWAGTTFSSGGNPQNR